MASKYAVKTYGRSYAKESASSKAFDEAVSGTGQQLPMKTSNTKWGNTSISRVRDEDPFEATYKKVKTEIETEDPFTFGLDDGVPPVKAEEPPVVASGLGRPALASTSATGLGRPAIPNVRIMKRQAMEEAKKAEEAKLEDDDIQPMFKRPVRTYSRASKRPCLEDPKQNIVDQYAAGPSDADDEMPVLEREQPVSEPISHSIGAEDDFGFATSETVVESGVYDQEDEDDEAPTLHKESKRVYTRRKDKVSPAKGLSKKHVLQSEDAEQEPTVLNFRSHFMDPAVYSKFAYTPREEDPVGRLNNSKVLQKSEIKHGKGSTLIVICSPKPPPVGETKVKLLQQKTVRDPYREYSEKGKNQEAGAGDSQSDVEVPSASSNNSSKELSQVSQSSESPDNSADDAEFNQAVASTSVSQNKGRRATKRKTESAENSTRVNKIFRSRNTRGRSKEMKMEDEKEQFEEPESNGETIIVCEGDVPVHEIKLSELNKSNAESAFGFDEGGGDGSQETNGQTNIKDEEIKEEDDDIQTTNEEISQLPDIMEVDSKKEDSQELSESSQSEFEDIDSSQNTLDSSQGSVDSQSDPRKKTSDKPREKKIFKSKNKALDLQKKVFQNSPKKSPSKAVYNVRSWQDDFDEEERVTLVKNNKNKSREGTPPVGAAAGGGGVGPPKLTPVLKQPPKFEEESNNTKKPLEPPKLSRAVHWPDRLGDEAYTSVHVTKEHKELFTVVKNVKEAHECQESGETQEFSDDVEYLLTGVQEGEPMSTRCLSCIGLAQKCILPSFRMHLRAHGTVAKIFGHLQEACTDPSLALCTALLMFMLSRDRLNMDLDRQSLDLMLKLLGIDNQEQLSATMTAASKRALNRNIERVKEVYAQLQQESGNKQPELESVSTGNLAMESLLSLTSRRAGEWFKEELRTLGALDHIVDTVCSCMEAVGDDSLLTDPTIENIKKIDRCLRVLENVTFVNTENQMYLISYKQGILVQSICRALKTCEKCLQVYPLPDSDKVDKEATGYVIYNCILAILRVLLNITHDNEFGSTKAGEQTGFISVLLTCILQTPQHVPTDMRFDLLVLSLGLMINLVEHCDINRRRIIESKTEPAYEFQKHSEDFIPAPKALVQVFTHRYEISKRMEEQDFGEATTPQSSPNKSGEWKESDSGIEWVVASAKKGEQPQEESPENFSREVEREQLSKKDDDKDDEDTFTKALHRAGKHMENSIVASYVALLLGCVIQDNSVFVDSVKEHLPNGSFDDMITILKKFLGFMNLTTAIGSSGGKSIAHVIEVLEGC